MSGGQRRWRGNMRSETEKMLSEGLYSGSAWKECAERLAGMALPDDERLAFACLRFACGERDALRRKSRS